MDARPTLLFVDRTHGTRAVMANLYADLVRAWSANNGQKWMFRRAAGAGYMIESSFRKSQGKLSSNETLIPNGGLLNETAMKALFHSEADFWSDNSPLEKAAIIKMMKARRKQGLPVEMVSYSHIICFDNETVRVVSRLCQLARSLRFGGNVNIFSQQPKIILIAGCDYKSENNLSATAQSIRAGLKEFFVQHLGWTRPPRSLADGGYRTQFVQLKHEWQKKMLLGKDSLGLERLGSKYGCRFHVSYDSKWTGWLLSITGPRHYLPDVTKKVCDMLNENN